MHHGQSYISYKLLRTWVIDVVNRVNSGIVIILKFNLTQVTIFTGKETIYTEDWNFCAQLVCFFLTLFTIFFYFWCFSWDEFAKYDIPATLDKVLGVSGASTLSYIGHSQGTTIAFAEFSRDQTWVSKVDIFIGMAPVAFVGHMISPLRYLAYISGEIEVLIVTNFVLILGRSILHGKLLQFSFWILSNVLKESHLIVVPFNLDVYYFL